MTIALKKSTRLAATTRQPGQTYSLSPIARLRTLPLPFETEPSKPEPFSGALAPHLIPLPLVANPQDTADTKVASRSQAAQQALMAQLTREVKRIEVAGRSEPAIQVGQRDSVISSGCCAMDGCLPSGGYESGTVIEYLQNCAGSGATTLALSAAREAMATTDRHCVVVDWRGQFYPPAAAALGIDLKRMVIVRPATLADRLWAIDQALRSPAIAAVVAEVEQVDDRAARRLQLAAECGGGLALLVRGAQRSQPSWAEVQWLVKPVMRSTSPVATSSPVTQTASKADNLSQPHRQLQLELLRVRGGQSGSRLGIQINASNGRLESLTSTANAATATLARTLSHPAITHPTAKLA